VSADPLAGPVSEFCAKLDELRAESGADVRQLAKRLGLSRPQLYAILAGRVKRPPEWDRVVRPLVDACTGGDPSALTAWRQRHTILTVVWEELRRRDRQASPAALIGQGGQQAVAVSQELPATITSQQVLSASPALAVPEPALPVREVGPSIIPWELPPTAAHFTGRTQELAKLTALLDRTRQEALGTVMISAISGTAGVGKTALAVYWAHQVADRFPGGQLYVNLRGYDPAQPVSATDALARFLRALGVPGQDIPPEVDERAARYRSLLAGRRMLVVLDNASSAEQVRPLLPGDPGCAAVVTSRDTLAGLVAADGAWRLDLGLLSLDEAVALLRLLIGGRADDAPAAAELAGLCARLPLALRIAAELALVRRPAPLRELVAELAAGRLDGLDAGEDRADIRAVFSWSWRQLPGDVARTFTLAGLHPGEDVDVHAVAALAGTTLGQARRAMGRLHRASLVQVSGTGRYAMHDLLRAYAREQAAVPGTDGSCRETLTRLFDYYLDAATAAMDLAFPVRAHRPPRVAGGAAVMPDLAGLDEARTWLDQELANLVAVVVHSAGHGWPRHAVDLGGQLYQYLLTTGHLPEAETIYGHALQAARQCGDPVAEARMVNSLGAICTVTGRFRDAARHYQVALELCRRCEDRVGEAAALSNIGLTEYYLHNHRSAAEFFRGANAAYQDAGDQLGAATALFKLSGAEMELGSLDEASGHLQLALRVFRDQKDEQREAEALKVSGGLSLRRGQLAQAAAIFEQALAIYRRLNFPVGVASGLRYLGEVALRRGDYQEAISLLRQALTLYRQVGDQYGVIFTLRNLAEALHGTGQVAAARTELVTALQLAAETGNTYEQATAHRDLAESHHGDGQDGQARYHWRQALALYTQLGTTEADHVRSQLSTHEAKHGPAIPSAN
jgi:tetratricopeptide (TPR) repeat protein